MMQLVLSKEFLVAGFILVISGFLMIAMKLVKRAPSLNQDEYRPFRLLRREELTPTVFSLVFALCDLNERAKIPIGHHVSLKYVDKEGNSVVRNYTPVSGPDTRGSVTIVLKVYKPDPGDGVRPPYIGGAMSFHLNSLAPGDTILMRGPKGSITYLGGGRFDVHKTHKKPEQERSAKNIVLLCGGTGVTPMLRIAQGELNPWRKEGEGRISNEVNVTMLYANSTNTDVPLKADFDKLSSEYPKRFKIVYFASKVEGGSDMLTVWKDANNEVGRMSLDMLKKHVPSFDAEGGTQYLICGPGGLVSAIKENLVKMGADESSWIVF